MPKLPVLFFAGAFFIGTQLAAQSVAPLFRNPKARIDQRVNDLLGQLTINEKIGLLGHEAKAVERLGIPAYNWWNEALHGVARAGNATVFPQAIALASRNDEVRLANPSGILSVGAEVRRTDDGWVADSAVVFRSARRLMQGAVAVPTRLF